LIVIIHNGKASHLSAHIENLQSLVNLMTIENALIQRFPATLKCQRAVFAACPSGIQKSSYLTRQVTVIIILLA
jgi:hypothetical protein